MGKMKEIWQDKKDLDSGISFCLEELNHFRDQLTSLDKKNTIPLLSKLTQNL